MRIRTLMVVGLLWAVANLAWAASLAESDRLRWWSEGRFGMFIHWGVYSLPARGEWVMHNERIPYEWYRTLADRFHPTRYDPDQWAALARDAGMKYMVLTSRHHDGYCLFDSKVSDYTAPKTGPGRDLLAEYVRACRKAGLKVGFYYSLLDWHHPDYWAGLAGDQAAWNRFVDYAHAQVRELCTQYGKLDLLWYDGGWDRDAAAWRSAELNAMVRRLQPGIIINDRSRLPEDYDTPEQEIRASRRPWETCMTLNDHWGYAWQDHNWKSPTTLIRNLATCVSGGGNYLLNVGPRRDGTISEESVARLREVGKWLRANGRAIYGCGRAPFTIGDLGVTTARGSTVYLHLFRWPGREMRLEAVKTRVLSARLPALGRQLRVRQDGETVTLCGLPERMPDERDTVVAVRLAAEAKR